MIILKKISHIVSVLLIFVIIFNPALIYAQKTPEDFLENFLNNVGREIPKDDKYFKRRRRAVLRGYKEVNEKYKGYMKLYNEEYRRAVKNNKEFSPIVFEDKAIEKLDGWGLFEINKGFETIVGYLNSIQPYIDYSYSKKVERRINKTREGVKPLLQDVIDQLDERIRVANEELELVDKKIKDFYKENLVVPKGLERSWRVPEINWVALLHYQIHYNEKDIKYLKRLRSIAKAAAELDKTQSKAAAKLDKTQSKTANNLKKRPPIPVIPAKVIEDLHYYTIELMESLKHKPARLFTSGKYHLGHFSSALNMYTAILLKEIAVDKARPIEEAIVKWVSKDNYDKLEFEGKPETKEVFLAGLKRLDPLRITSWPGHIGFLTFSYIAEGVQRRLPVTSLMKRTQIYSSRYLYGRGFKRAAGVFKHPVSRQGTKFLGGVFTRNIGLGIGMWVGGVVTSTLMLARDMLSKEDDEIKKKALKLWIDECFSKHTILGTVSFILSLESAHLLLKSVPGVWEWWRRFKRTRCKTLARDIAEEFGKPLPKTKIGEHYSKFLETRGGRLYSRFLRRTWLGRFAANIPRTFLVFFAAHYLDEYFWAKVVFSSVKEDREKSFEKINELYNSIATKLAITVIETYVDNKVKGKGDKEIYEDIEDSLKPYKLSYYGNTIMKDLLAHIDSDENCLKHFDEYFQEGKYTYSKCKDLLEEEGKKLTNEEFTKCKKIYGDVKEVIGCLDLLRKERKVIALADEHFQTWKEYQKLSKENGKELTDEELDEKREEIYEEVGEKIKVYENCPKVKSAEQALVSSQKGPFYYYSLAQLPSNEDKQIEYYKKAIEKAKDQIEEFNLKERIEDKGLEESEREERRDYYNGMKDIIDSSNGPLTLLYLYKGEFKIAKEYLEATTAAGDFTKIFANYLNKFGKLVDCGKKSNAIVRKKENGTVEDGLFYDLYNELQNKLNNLNVGDEEFIEISNDVDKWYRYFLYSYLMNVRNKCPDVYDSWKLELEEYTETIIREYEDRERDDLIFIYSIDALRYIAHNLK